MVRKPKRANNVSDECVVDVRTSSEGTARGFVMLGRYVVTACHCLPRLPDPEEPESNVVELEVKRLGAKAFVSVCVVHADPCGDLAVLSYEPRSGGYLESSEEAMEHLLNGESARPITNHSVQPHMDAWLWTHEDRRIAGRVVESQLILSNPRHRISSGTSGSPVFDENGRVLGVISTSLTGGNEARISLLADNLPGWLLAEVAREYGPIMLDGKQPDLETLKQRALLRAASRRKL